MGVQEGIELSRRISKALDGVHLLEGGVSLLVWVWHGCVQNYRSYAKKYTEKSAKLGGKAAGKLRASSCLHRLSTLVVSYPGGWI